MIGLALLKNFIKTRKRHRFYHCLQKVYSVLCAKNQSIKRNQHQYWTKK